jgi:hypothetical protein
VPSTAAAIESNGSAHDRPAAAVRTFFAIALQLARVFPQLVELVRAAARDDRRACQRASLAIADAVLDGARDRGSGKFLRSLIDQQRRHESLNKLRPSRSGRTPQAVARRRQGER